VEYTVVVTGGGPPQSRGDGVCEGGSDEEGLRSGCGGSTMVGGAQRVPTEMRRRGPLAGGDPVGPHVGICADVKPQEHSHCRDSGV